LNNLKYAKQPADYTLILAGLFKDPDLFQTRDPNEDRNDIFNYIHFNMGWECRTAQANHTDILHGFDEFWIIS
jgi:hypothetical protein